MARLFVKLFVVVLVLSQPSALVAADRCERLHADYKAATARIAAALRSYANCIDNGDPRQACSSQYERLRAGQRLLSVSTSDFARYCRNWPVQR